MGAYSSDIDRALRLASHEHQGQVRKGSRTPYIAHPMMVSLILQRAGLPDEVVIAGILHDVVEDQEVTVEEVERDFGRVVAELVDAVTEKKTEDGRERPWKVRKTEALEHLAEATEHIVALKAADALHNCMSTIADLERDGTGAWDKFKTSADEQVWYYRSIAEIVERLLGDHRLAEELRDAVERLADHT